LKLVALIPTRQFRFPSTSTVDVFWIFLHIHGLFINKNLRQKWKRMSPYKHNINLNLIVLNDHKFAGFLPSSSKKCDLTVWLECDERIFCIKKFFWNRRKKWDGKKKTKQKGEERIRGKVVKEAAILNLFFLYHKFLFYYIHRGKKRSKKMTALPAVYKL
jgi:hypothetical protein